jgi:hypothetical protein
MCGAAKVAGYKKESLRSVSFHVKVGATIKKDAVGEYWPPKKKVSGYRPSQVHSQTLGLISTG